LQAAKIKIAGLESEIAELKAENAELREKAGAGAKRARAGSAFPSRCKQARELAAVFEGEKVDVRACRAAERTHKAWAFFERSLWARYHEELESNGKEARHDDSAHEGTDADPETAAEVMKPKFAALDDASDPGPIPECLRRSP
jgi:hypothetical protein